jgi:excisionase family DNA binding protein
MFSGMTSAHESDLLSPGEVAALFRVDPRTVTRWVKKGQLPAAVTTPGGHRRYRRSDIEPFLTANTAPGLDR